MIPEVVDVGSIGLFELVELVVSVEWVVSVELVGGSVAMAEVWSWSLSYNQQSQQSRVSGPGIAQLSVVS
jgi:hypothetical protein